MSTLPPHLVAAGLPAGVAGNPALAAALYQARQQQLMQQQQQQQQSGNAGGQAGTGLPVGLPPQYMAQLGLMQQQQQAQLLQQQQQLADRQGVQGQPQPGFGMNNSNGIAIQGQMSPQALLAQQQRMQQLQLIQRQQAQMQAAAAAAGSPPPGSGVSGGPSHSGPSLGNQQNTTAPSGPSTSTAGPSKEPAKKKPKKPTKKDQSQQAAMMRAAMAPPAQHPVMPPRPPTVQEVQAAYLRGDAPRLQRTGLGTLPEEYIKPVPDTDPTGDELERVTARDLAITRYKMRHEYMEEVFSPVAIVDLPKVPPAYTESDIDALERRVAEMEKSNAEAEQTADKRLKSLKESFENATRGIPA